MGSVFLEGTGAHIYSSQQVKMWRVAGWQELWPEPVHDNTKILDSKIQNREK